MAQASSIPPAGPKQHSIPSVRIQVCAEGPKGRPSLPRSGHCLATLPDWHKDDAIMFGGYVESADLNRYATNEAWTFNKGTMEWTRVEYTGQALPRPRLTTQTVVTRDAMWVIGGWDPATPGSGGDILNDLWKLDLRTYSWKQVHVQGAELPTISRFQAVTMGDKIYIHTHRSLEDILVLDVSTEPPTLEKVTVHGMYPDDISPASRGLHSMTAVGNSLYVFGGAPTKGPMMDDLWKLDLDTMTWRPLHPSGPKPHARCSHAAGSIGDFIVFFGGAFYGQGGGLVMSDTLFLLDTTRSSWVFPPTVGKLPSARNAAAMCNVDGGLLMHGGWVAFKETHNDTYLMSLELPSQASA